MKIILHLVLLIIIVGSNIGFASATNYYVATWGNNSGTGTLIDPLATPSYAVSQVVAGDSIYLLNGTTIYKKAL